MLSEDATHKGDEADEARDAQLGTCAHHEGAAVMVPTAIAMGFAAYRQGRWADQEDLMISTRDLTLLPDVDGLRRTLQSMAMLDAVLCPEWQDRYYSFNAAWGIGQQMGSMRNGSGDDFFAHFGPAGCWVKGFAHEYPMSPYSESPKRVWSGVLDSVPDEFAGCLREPAFTVEDVTFCIWRRYGDNRWQVGPVAFPPVTRTRTDRSSSCPTWTAGPRRTGLGRGHTTIAT